MLSICIYAYIAIAVVALIFEIFSKDTVVGHLTNTKLYKECDVKILAYISLITIFIVGSPFILLYHLCVVLEYLFSREERLNIDTDVDVKTLITKYNKLLDSPVEKKKEEIESVEYYWNAYVESWKTKDPDKINHWKKLYESKCKEESETVQWNGWNGFARRLRVAEPERKDYLDSWKEMYKTQCKELEELGLITIVHNSKKESKTGELA